MSRRSTTTWEMQPVSRSSGHRAWLVLLTLLLAVLAAARAQQGSRVGPLNLQQQQVEEAATWLAEVLQAAEQRSSAAKRSESPMHSSLWFGPRLGRRRRRAPPDVEQDEMLMETEEDVAAFVELLREAPWTVVALKEYPGFKRQGLAFTPRLGRELPEQISSDVLQGSSLGVRSPPFSPRLGRGNGLPFSPRLGRHTPEPSEQQQQQPH